MASQKFKAHANFSDLTADWPGQGTKVKLRVPREDGTKMTVYFGPGDVLETADARSKRAFSEWRPPPVAIGGSAWKERTQYFDGTTTDPTDQDLDT